MSKTSLDLSGFLISSKFSDEIEKFNKKYRAKFAKSFKLTLAQLKESGKDIYRIDRHEILKDTKLAYKMYSLHLRTDEFNIRILVAFEDSHIYLLLAFNEDSHNTYDKYIPIANERFIDMKGKTYE